MFLISCRLIAQVNDFSTGIPGSSYRIHPGNTIQTETFIVRSPLDQHTFFSSCITITFAPFISEGVYCTNDDGVTWRGNDTCTGTPVAYHGGDPGITINKDGTFILTHKDSEPFVGLYSHYSYDQGRTWSPQQIISNDDLEKAVLLSESRPGKPGFGRTYAAWIKFASPFPLMFAFTDDGAKTWSTPKPINNPSNRSAGGDLALGPDGTLYSCWAGVTGTSPFKEILVGFASSHDAGVNWNVNENIFQMNGITGILTDKNNIRVNGLPSIAVDTTNGPRKGWIYIITGQKSLSPAGNDPDIILNRSTDGGQTWSAGIRVNQDPLNNGKTQYFPAIHIDRSGTLNILFYDDRNTTSDSAGVFLARSGDGGDTWQEFELCEHHFKPAAVGGGLGQGFQGDNIDMSSTDTKLIPVWMDNSTGIYQIWTKPVNFSDINDINEKDVVKSVLLMQNQPNPFSNSTTIHYKVKKAGHVLLNIFNLSGKKISTLVDGSQQAGEYDAMFVPPSDLSTGTFIYQLQVSDRTETKKMNFIKAKD